MTKQQRRAEKKRKRLARKLEKRSQRLDKPYICYRRRVLSCQTLGFKDYDEYLASKLWAEVRERVLERDRRRCLCCKRPAIQVHHSSYNTDTLAGRDLRWLASVCGGCHLDIEFRPNGSKRTPAEVGKTYAIMRRSFRSKVFSGLVLHGEPLDPLTAEFRAIVGANFYVSNPLTSPATSS
jgi:hypothetical protein